MVITLPADGCVFNFFGLGDYALPTDDSELYSLAHNNEPKSQSPGVIMLDFLPKRSTITGVYYANLLDQLRTAILENAEVNSLKFFCCNRTARESTLAKLQWML